MTKSNYRVLHQDELTPYFLTLTTIKWLPLFSKPEVAQIVFDSLRFLQEQQDIRVHAYILLENHIHLVLSSSHLSKQINRFKSYTARQALDYYQQSNNRFILNQLNFSVTPGPHRQEYKFWQEGYHPQEIQDEDMLLQKIEYIHNNPVKRGYVELPEHWLYSSARNYAGLKGILEVDRDW